MIHEYTDWQMHYETCPRCKPWWTCPVGEAIRKRESETCQS